MSACGDSSSGRADGLRDRRALALAGERSDDTRCRVLVVDANLLTAQAVAMALTQFELNTRVAVPTAAGYVREIETWEPDVALLDIDPMGSVAMLACIRTLFEAGVPTAIVTGNLDTVLAGEAVRAWAIPVVDKAASLSELVTVISRILEGGTVLTEPERQSLLERRSHLAPFEVLTHREKFVLSQLMEGQSAEVIARGSFVSISTVRSQIKAILQKLGVNSQLAAASMARQVGWTFVPTEDTAGRRAVADGVRPNGHRQPAEARELPEAAAVHPMDVLLSGPPGPLTSSR